MRRGSDPEAIFKGHPRRARSRSPLLASLATGALFLGRKFGLYRPTSFRRILVTICSFILLSIVLGVIPPARRLRRRVLDLVTPPWEDTDLNTPPRYLDLIERQTKLPQHNLSLPYPEGATGRYVKFTSQVNKLGWNNVFNELLMLTWLAYRSDRAYVFQDYVWKMSYYQWPERKAWHHHARTPLPALISGPTAGGSWAPGDLAPRSIHESHWEIVCPKNERKIIWTHLVKREFDLHWVKTGKQIFDVWNKILKEDPARCIEVKRPHRSVEDFGQVFDLWLWGSDRILDMWEEIRDSPVSQLLGTSPLIQRTVDRNEHLFYNKDTVSEDPFDQVFAVHIRRGDYKAACVELANWNSTFYSWNLLPWLPDRFPPPPGGSYGKNTPENTKEYFLHCLPDMDRIIDRINSARDDWEREVLGDGRKSTSHFINTLYILTNDNSKWFKEFQERLKQHQWHIVTSHQIVFGDAQEKDVAMVTDMELARKAAIFMGNGWSSFTSNILHRRLVDKKVAISNRFF